MDEEHGAELLGFLQHGMIFLAREVGARHAAADRRTTQPLFLHSGLELLDRQIRVLQCQRGEAGKAIGLGSAQLSEFLVLNFDDLSRQVAILAVPERIDRQDLHVDRHCVHLLETLVDDDEVLLHALHGRRDARGVLPHQVDRFLEEAMRVAVDGLDALALDHHGQPYDWRLLRLGMRFPRQAAAAEDQACERATFSEEISARRHGIPPSILCNL